MKASKHQIEFMERYEPLHEGFTRFCSSRSYGVMETADLVQETLLVTYERYEKLKDKKALMAYMMRAAVNIINSKLRRKKFSADYDQQAFEQLIGIAPNAEVATDVDFLYRCIRELPEGQRRVIELFEISGFSLKETADILDVSVSSVKVRLHRARKRLQSDLEPQRKDLIGVLSSLTLLF